MKVSDIADALKGELIGNGSLEITDITHPMEARGRGDLAIATDEDMLDLLTHSNAAAALVSVDAEVPDGILEAVIKVRRSRVALGLLTEIFSKPLQITLGIHPSAIVDPSANIGENPAIDPFVYVGPGASIGDGCQIMSHVTIGAGAKIGSGAVIHSGVRVGERVNIGDRVIIQQNASIGSDGFSFVTPEAGSVEETKGVISNSTVCAKNVSISRINSLASVTIGSDAEIGACAAIDRGTITDTKIGDNTKIDNLVQIGHNVTIGDHCMICGQVGVAGSVVIGDRVVLAGQVGVKDHVKIGDDVVVGGGSGVATDIPNKMVVIGYPAIPKDEMAAQYLNVRRLGSVFKDIRRFKARLKALESQTEKG